MAAVWANRDVKAVARVVVPHASATSLTLSHTTIQGTGDNKVLVSETLIPVEKSPGADLPCIRLTLSVRAVGVPASTLAVHHLYVTVRTAALSEGLIGALGRLARVWVEVVVINLLAAS